MIQRMQCSSVAVWSSIIKEKSATTLKSIEGLLAHVTTNVDYDDKTAKGT